MVGIVDMPGNQIVDGINILGLSHSINLCNQQVKDYDLRFLALEGIHSRDTSDLVEFRYLVCRIEDDFDLTFINGQAPG